MDSFEIFAVMEHNACAAITCKLTIIHVLNYWAGSWVMNNNLAIFVFHFVLKFSCSHHYFQFIGIPSLFYIFFLFFSQVRKFNCSEFSLAVNQNFLVQLLTYYFPNIFIVSYAWIVWIFFCEDNLEADLIWRKWLNFWLILYLSLKIQDIIWINIQLFNNLKLSILVSIYLFPYNRSLWKVLLYIF